MKIDILQQLNTELLDYALHCAKASNVSYILVNQNTHRLIGVLPGAVKYSGGGGYYLTYKGFTFGICDCLADGELEFVTKMEIKEACG